MIRSHALRAAVSEEMHVRRLPRFAAPCRLMQVVTMIGEGAGSAARRHIDALAETAEIRVPVAEKYAVIVVGAVTLVWERHTEFATYTLLRAGDFDAPFDPAHFEPLLAAILADMPGEIVRATQIALIHSASSDPTADDLES